MAYYRTPHDVTTLPAWQALNDHREAMQNFSMRDAFNVEEDSPVVDFLLTIRDTAASTFDTAKQKVSDFLTAFQNTGPAQAASDIFATVWESCKSLAGSAGDLIGQ